MPRDGAGHFLRNVRRNMKNPVSYAYGSGFCVWDLNNASIRYLVRHHNTVLCHDDMVVEEKPSKITPGRLQIVMIIRLCNFRDNRLLGQNSVSSSKGIAWINSPSGFPNGNLMVAAWLREGLRWCQRCGVAGGAARIVCPFIHSGSCRVHIGLSVSGLPKAKERRARTFGLLSFNLHPHERACGTLPTPQFEQHGIANRSQL
jgi:hypothetical protein